MVVLGISYIAFLYGLYRFLLNWIVENDARIFDLEAEVKTLQNDRSSSKEGTEQ